MTATHRNLDSIVIVLTWLKFSASNVTNTLFYTSPVGQLVRILQEHLMAPFPESPRVCLGFPREAAFLLPWKCLAITGQDASPSAHGQPLFWWVFHLRYFRVNGISYWWKRLGSHCSVDTDRATIEYHTPHFQNLVLSSLTQYLRVASFLKNCQTFCALLWTLSLGHEIWCYNPLWVLVVLTQGPAACLKILLPKMTGT